MPAHIFELLFMYITLEKMEGKPPSIYRLVGVLGRTNKALLDTKKLAYELGYILEPPAKKDRNPHWMRLTEVGANEIVRILDRCAKVVFTRHMSLCKDRKLFPKNIVHVLLSDRQYTEYLQGLKGVQH